MGWPPGNLGAWRVWGQPSCGLLGVLMLLECGEAYKFLLHLLLSHYGSPSPPRGGGLGSCLPGQGDSCWKYMVAVTANMLMPSRLPTCQALY